MQSDSISCVHDGVTLRGSIFEPGAAPAGNETRATVLMFPGGAGPGPSFHAAGRELAQAGYRVVNADMYGADADLSDPQAAGQHYISLLSAPELLRARAITWLELARALPGADAARIAAIGYCFGGKCVLELARSGAALSSVTSFHGLLTTHAPARPGAVNTQVAIWAAGRDPYAPVADYEAVCREFDSAAAKLQATLFNWAQHSFTDPDHDGYADGIGYDAGAHAIAWSGTLALLNATIGSKT